MGCGVEFDVLSSSIEEGFPVPDIGLPEWGEMFDDAVMIAKWGTTLVMAFVSLIVLYFWETSFSVSPCLICGLGRSPYGVRNGVGEP